MEQCLLHTNKSISGNHQLKTVHFQENYPCKVYPYNVWLFCCYTFIIVLPLICKQAQTDG